MTSQAEKLRVATRSSKNRSAVGADVARKPIPTQSKSDNGAARNAGRVDHVSDDGLHRGSESANFVASGDSSGRGSVCDMPFVRGGDAGDGVVCELSDRAGAGNVAECIFHILGLPGNACGVASSIGCGVFFGRVVCAADGDASTGTDRKWHSAKLEASDGGRDRDVHRVCGIAKRKAGDSESGDACKLGAILATAKYKQRVWGLA